MMRKISRLILVVAVALSPTAAAGAKSKKPGAYPDAYKDSVVAPKQLVRKIYANKSWIWPDGAGYFSDDGSFIAWYGGEKDAGYAKGRWAVYRWGNMCMLARWHSPKGSRNKTTCFRHRVTGDVILQKRDPKGRWYVFKDAQVKESNEINKLIDKDVVTEKFAEIRARYVGNGTVK